MSSPGTDPARTAFGDRPHPHPDSRLYAARDDYLICCLELFGRQNSLPDGKAPHPCGMAALPKTDRQGDGPGTGTSPDCRQLCYAQAQEGAAMAEAASPYDAPLYPDQQFVDESGGAFLCRSDSGLRARGE